MEAKGATLQTIARWAAWSEGTVDVTLQDGPTTYTVGLGMRDVLATQRQAHIYIERCGLIGDTLQDVVVARHADV
jgi:hypothetical protein